MIAVAVFLQAGCPSCRSINDTDHRKFNLASAIPDPPADSWGKGFMLCNGSTHNMKSVSLHQYILSVPSAVSMDYNHAVSPVSWCRPHLDNHVAQLLTCWLGCCRVRKQVVNIPSFIVRLDSQKHIDFSLKSPYGGGRPGKMHNFVVLSHEVLAWLSGASCRWFAYGPADATAAPSSFAPVNSRMVFWCQLMQVALEKSC